MTLSSRNLQLIPRILLVGPEALQELRLERPLAQDRGSLEKEIALRDMVQKNSSTVEPCATYFSKERILVVKRS